jgi:hypothetical protein
MHSQHHQTFYKSNFIISWKHELSTNLCYKALKFETTWPPAAERSIH